MFMRSVWREITCALIVASFAAASYAQAPAASGDAPPPAATPEQLEKLVGPIALYPDDLVAIILPASTSPLQLVQAERYLEKRKADPKLPIDDKMDDAVKSLLNYPEIVKKMSGDLDWTVDLGEAVVADQGAVLDAIQAFRRKSQAAGHLKTDDKQVVVVEKEIVKIVPANPEVIYVPQYNPASVVVYSSVPAWGYYPAPYPSYYYPYAPGAALAAGVIWGAAIGAAWSGNRYGWGGGNDININRNTNISTGGNTTNIGSGNRGGASASQRPAGGNTAWKSDKKPGQVSGGTGRGQNAGRVGDGGGRGGDSQFGGGDRGGGGRASTQPAGGGGRGGDSQFGAAATEAVADAHRRSQRAVVDAVATRSSAAAATEAVADAHRRNRRAVEDAVATSVVATGDHQAARHRWTVRAVRQVAARCPVAVLEDAARAPARAEAVVERAAAAVDAAAVVDDRKHYEQHLSN